MKSPFDLDKMLHRSQAEPKREQWSFRKIFSSIVGITPEYTKGDKIIAWSAVVYVLVVNFFILFVGVVVFNIFCPFSNAQWSIYFLIQALVIPGAMAVVVTVWFSIGGIHDLIDLFRNLKHLKNNPDDDGRVLKKHE